ncbi:MAG: glycosyltransferase family 4 protein [Planctomycetota bacterium]|nr:glycosyltransferase family 4 protein [Planctomycetota bacterium]
MNDPLRVGLVIKQFSLSVGGAERHSVVLARELLRLGHEVHVFAREEGREKSVPVHFHPVVARKRSGARKILSFAQGAREVIGGVDLDVVHGLTQIWPQDVHRAGGGVHRWWFRQKYPNRFFRFWARLTPKEIAQHRVEEEIYKEGQYGFITTNSELVRLHLMDEYAVSGDRVEVVRNGFDSDLFGPHVRKSFREEIRHELGLDPLDAPLLVFASNNFGRKGLGVLLRAMAGDSHSPIQLAVAGAGKVRAFQRLAQSLGIAQRVRFLGRVDRVERIYAAGDAFVLPTLHDPFANVCLEAMACGLPVITTRTNGASEIIEPGASGEILSDPLDIEALRRAIASVLGDPEKTRRMGDRAASTVASFTPEANARQNVDIYRKAMALRVD